MGLAKRLFLTQAAFLLQHWSRFLLQVRHYADAPAFTGLSTSIGRKGPSFTAMFNIAAVSFL